MLACHCLNVIIETEEDDFQKVTVEMLGLSPEETHDNFFKQDIQQVGKLININKSHSGLIQTRNVGAWVVHHCVNCDVLSHAVHREKGASCVLVNSKLLASQSVESVRASKKFSKMYKIVVNADEIPEDDPIANSYIPSDVENVIKGFKQIAADALKNEALAVEDRIKQFTDQQYSRLNELRDRTFREQQALTKIILSNTVTDSSKPASTNTGMSSNPQGIPSRLNEPLAVGSNIPSSPNSMNLTRHTPKRQKSCPSSQVNSFDTEGLFEFDGIDDILSGDESEPAESDLDDNKEENGVKIAKNRRASGGNTVAKSLPMSIPIFLPQTRNGAFEDIDDMGPVERSLDIAASIKALAKSVQGGDAVFGDVPKPRYTYL